MLGKKKLLIAVVGAALLAVLVLGTAMAESNPGTKTAGRAESSYRQVFLEKLAARLGIDRSRLDAAIKQAGDDVIDVAVKDGKLTQKQAERMRQNLEKNGWLSMWDVGHGRRGAFGHGGPFREKNTMRSGGLDAAAGALGLTRDELKAQLKDGKSLGEVADARGVDRQKVKDALVSAVKQKLDEAVRNGDLTQQQADQMLKRFQAKNLLDKPMGHRPRQPRQAQQAP